MDNKEIRSFIDNLVYDFETIQRLQEFSRHKETLPILDAVCDRIKVFQQRINEGPYDLNGLFKEDFWDGQMFSGLKASDLRVKIGGLSKEWSHVLDEDLKELNYNDFVSLFEFWVFENINMLEKRIKSNFRKKVESILIWILGAIVIVGLLLGSTSCLITKNWGLKGDFYEGENFEKYLCAGDKKTIDFPNPEEMNGNIPHDHFSTRWQGRLLVPEDGEYTISMEVDDGARLFIDGRLLIDAWKIGRANPSKKVHLNKGTHRIVLKYFQHDGDAYLRLYWARGNALEEIIQAKYLRRL